jgi:hypothetical protein
MAKRKRRLSRQRKVKEKRVEKQLTLDNQIKRKKSLGAFRKHEKTKPRSPDVTGKLYFQRHTLAEISRQLNEDGGDEIGCNIAGWKNSDQNGQYLTVEVSPEFVRYGPHTRKPGMFDDIFDDDEWYFSVRTFVPSSQDLRVWISGEEKTISSNPHPPKVGTNVGVRPRVPPLTSARTAKYIHALVREGDSFDYDKWLERVREQEADAKQAEAGTSGELTAAQIAGPIKTSGNQHVRPNPALSLIPKTLQVPIARRPHRQAKSATTKARLRGWLEKVRCAWGEFHPSRRRDAVYGYLEAVFGIVEHYRVRRRTNRLLRHAFEFGNLPFDTNADPFTAVIRCTCGNTVDNKTTSKWSRALRYVARSKQPDIGLQAFMKEAGGVDACADGYARLQRRSKGPE